MVLTIHVFTIKMTSPINKKSSVMVVMVILTIQSKKKYIYPSQKTDVTPGSGFLVKKP